MEEGFRYPSDEPYGRQNDHQSGIPHADRLHPPQSPPPADREDPKIFSRFTPIVIGYGGNDGSLMTFLRALDPIEGGIFWCHRHGSAIEPAIHEVVEHHRGKLVPILGFDELMLQLQEKLKLDPLLCKNRQRLPTPRQLACR